MGVEGIYIYVYSNCDDDVEYYRAAYVLKSKMCQQGYIYSHERRHGDNDPKDEFATRDILCTSSHHIMHIMPFFNVKMRMCLFSFVHKA